jgi:type IV pilus assembly PilM-like protein
VKELPFMNLSPIYIEISHGWLKALRENDGLDVPLERAANGQLTAACKETLAQSLHKFLERKGWQPRARAVCAIPANGVSLRRMALPSAARDEFPKLIRMQIETEFPLPPDELAWGYRSLGSLPANGAASRQELLVAAVKKDRIDEYAGVLFAAGLTPVFTPAALARAYLCPQPLASCALIDVGQTQLELVTFENGVPVTLRVFSWGTEKRLDALAKAIDVKAGKVYVTGSIGSPKELIADLRSKFGLSCEQLDTASGTGQSAAVLGLKRASEQNVSPALLLIQTAAKPSSIGSFKFSQPPVPKKWAVRVAALLAALLILPYAEALLLKGHLSKKLAAIKSGQGKLSTIDHEYDLLQNLKLNGPPYLDALYLFAKSAPQGARFESTSMNRRGDISLRGTMQNAQQVTDFRAKLIDSGFFDRVTVEEQVPTPDRQKVNIRITAQWKPVEKRLGLAIGPTHDEIEKAKTNTVGQGNSPMRGGMPPGMPAGMPADVMIMSR